MNNTSAGGGEGTGRDYSSTSSIGGAGGGGQDSDYKTGNYPPEGDCMFLPHSPPVRAFHEGQCADEQLYVYDIATSSGGYGSTTNSFASKPSHSHDGPTSTFSPNSSNSNTNSDSDANLITQSTNGTSLTHELDDAKQGVDGRSRDTYAHEQHTHGQDNTTGAGGGEDGGELNPYGGSSIEGRDEAGERLVGDGWNTQGGQ